MRYEQVVVVVGAGFELESWPFEREIKFRFSFRTKIRIKIAIRIWVTITIKANKTKAEPGWNRIEFETWGNNTENDSKSLIPYSLHSKCPSKVYETNVVSSTNVAHSF